MKIPSYLEKDSLKWYYNLVKTSLSGLPTKIIGTRKATVIDPGQMYFFRYDAKHKATLPYWDAFPLIFPLSRLKGGFNGLNMHYLPPKLRKVFFDELMQYKRPNGGGLAIDYGRLKSSMFLKFTIHRYLTDHLKSNLWEVAEENWDKVVYLPTQNFQKASAEYVWGQI